MKAPLIIIFISAVWFGASDATLQQHQQQCDNETPRGDPYAVLGVDKKANQETTIKSYRLLAKRWHPDKNKGVVDAKAIFSTIAHAYEVLLDPEKREILDRLGEAGLVRLRDGDPTVKKDYLPPDEVLRRLHLDKDGPEPWHQWLVTSSFAYLASFDLHQLRWIPILLGLVTEAPYVIITATDDTTGETVMSGATVAADVTFKLSLSGKSMKFKAGDVTHNCAESKFLGMKTTYYLQCAHSSGHNVSVSVSANTFKTHGCAEYNSASAVFSLAMA